jgi:hypothetical protein
MFHSQQKNINLNNKNSFQMTSYYEIEVLISELSKNSLKIPKSKQKPYIENG